MVGIRALGIAVLTLWSQLNGKSALTLLSARWDSLWYARVVTEGYGYTVTAADGRRLSDLAFFPLLPWFENVVSRVTGLSLGHAGLAISALASVAAAAGIHAVVAETMGPRVALLTVIVWAALPVSVVQSMAYSESLFTALAAWSLYAVARERWITAAALASTAELTRATGIAVAVAVWIGCALAVRRTGRMSPRIAISCVLTPVGGAAYALWVGHRTGSVFGYLTVQKAWGNGFDGGVAFSRFVAAPLGGSVLVAGSVLVLMSAALALVHFLGHRIGMSVPVQAYSGIVALLALCTSGYFGSKPRLLIPAFGLLVPLAYVLARAGRRWTVTVIGVLICGSAVYGAFWLNGSGPP